MHFKRLEVKITLHYQWNQQREIRQNITTFQKIYELRNHFILIKTNIHLTQISKENAKRIFPTLNTGCMSSKNINAEIKRFFGSCFVSFPNCQFTIITHTLVHTHTHTLSEYTRGSTRQLSNIELVLVPSSLQVHMR